MAIYEGYDTLNTINSLDISWEGKTGKEVEDFISRRLEKPIGETITYDQETLTIYNPEGKPIASGQITVVPPTYSTDVKFTQLVVNGAVNDSDVSVNYTETSTFVAGINVKTYYEVSGKYYNLSNRVSVVFSIEGTTD
jgi:hypothetical protein